MWSTEGTNEQKSGLAGLAFVGGVCGHQKTSIVEEKGSFASIPVISFI